MKRIFRMINGKTAVEIHTYVLLLIKKKIHTNIRKNIKRKTFSIDLTEKSTYNAKRIFNCYHFLIILQIFVYGAKFAKYM